jgi:LysM repeat protein
MTPIRILAPSLLAFVLASCAAQKPNTYDTANPYGTADAGQVNAPVTEPANPVYDTPAAYEESSATAAAAPVAADTNIQTPSAPNAPSNGAAIIHTVVAGDTLSGISSKYKVPAATIKQANNMTKDTVVLGRKMVIPPVR